MKWRLKGTEQIHTEGLSKFHSNIYSIFFAYSTSLLFIITNTHSIGTVKHTWRFHPLDTVLLIFYIFDSFLITYLFSVIIYKKIVSLHIKIWFTIFFWLSGLFFRSIKKNLLNNNIWYRLLAQLYTFKV